LIAGLFAIGAGAFVFFSHPEPPATRLDAPAPGFELPALDGGALSLEDFRGRVVFVNFWATWCAPCEEEAPSLERLRRGLGGEGFEVLSVSIDDPASFDEVEKFRRELSLSFPILLDPEREVYDRYGATGVPETYLIDARGRLAERFIGPRDWDEERYALSVRRLIAASSEEESGG
jgi:peroxiredoxin